MTRRVVTKADKIRTTVLRSRYDSHESCPSCGKAAPPAYTSPNGHDSRSGSPKYIRWYICWNQNCKVTRFTV